MKHNPINVNNLMNSNVNERYTVLPILQAHVAYKQTSVSSKFLSKNKMLNSVVTDPSSPSKDLSDIFQHLPDNAADSEIFSKDVALILCGMGMEKYIDIFKAENINLETIQCLSASDLKQLGVDEKDCQHIIINLHDACGTNKRKACTRFKVDANPSDDILMINNCLKHLIYLGNYVSYVSLQMKKAQLVDCFATNDRTATNIVKMLSSKALLQVKKMSELVWDVKDGQSIINLALQAEDMTLPPIAVKRLQSKKKKGQKDIALKAMVIVGFSSVIIWFTKQYLKQPA